MLAKYARFISSSVYQSLVNQASCSGAAAAVSHRWAAYSTYTDDDKADSTKEPKVESSDPAAAAVPDSSSKGGLRSLSEVLGQGIVLPASSPAHADGPTEAELELLFSDLLPSDLGKRPSTAPQPSSSTSSSTSSIPAQASGEAPATSQPAKEDPKQKLIHEKYGYATLGGIIPTEDAKDPSRLFQAQPRLHPGRTFTPGQSYEPWDLSVYADPSAGSRTRQRVPRLQPTALDVQQLADYKNVAFLEKFITPAGRLLPRKKTKLPVHAHVHVMRQIKVARNMGLMAHETRLEKQHLRSIRDMEQLRQQQQGVM